MLTIQNSTSTKTYLLTDTVAPPYLKINSTGYLPLTTKTTTGLQLKISRGDKTYRAVELTKSYISAKSYTNYIEERSGAVEIPSNPSDGYRYSIEITATASVNERENEYTNFLEFTRTSSFFGQDIPIKTITATYQSYYEKTSFRETAKYCSTIFNAISSTSRFEMHTETEYCSYKIISMPEINTYGTFESSYSWPEESYTGTYIYTYTFTYSTYELYTSNLITSSELINGSITRITNKIIASILSSYSEFSINSSGKTYSRLSTVSNLNTWENIQEIATWT